MIGQRLGNYRVVRELGRGGMGVVYLAEHALIDRCAAVKVLRAELSRDRRAVRRLFNEARAVTRVRHPGIVEVFDFGVHDDGRAYVIMELLDGESLGARLARVRRLEIPVAVALAAQVAQALAAVHACGVIHRDLKPDNIHVVPDLERPGRERIKLLDFGIAKLGDGAVATQTGTVMGTPAYMSPEQCHGARDVDHRTDVYALGCVLFELIAGRRPFVGDGSGELLGAHQFVEPPRLDEVCPEVSPALAALVGELLAKRAIERPPSMRAVIDRLAPFTEAAWLTSGLPAPAAPVGALATLPPSATRDRRELTTLGAVPSQVEARRAPPPSRRRWVSGVALGLGATAAIAAALLRPWQEASAEAPVAESVEAPAETPPVIAAEPPVAAPPIATEQGAADVEIELKLWPPKAHVFVDDKPLAGRLRLSPTSGRHRLKVSAPGYLSETRTIDAAVDRSVTIKLERKSTDIEPPHGVRAAPPPPLPKTTTSPAPAPTGPPIVDDI